MSFVSDVFKVSSVERLTRFCDVLGVKYDVLSASKGEVIIYSDCLVEPPTTFRWPNTNKEEDIDFDAEIRKLALPGEKIVYRVEYEVEIHPSGDVEYYCEEMAGMPPEGDLIEKANTDAGRVLI